MILKSPDEALCFSSNYLCFFIKNSSACKANFANSDMMRVQKMSQVSPLYTHKKRELSMEIFLADFLIF